MCGITGIFRLDNSSPDLATVRSMTDRLAHRGPDGEGFWTEGPVAFGHRRLAIIDVAGSPQPMTTSDGRFTIAFNGEIVNYQELRAANRLDCRTSGDTEVLLLLLQRFGTAALPMLRGQFAFALWDRDTQSLMLARDRMGVLPLFLQQDARQVVFASELKALRPALGSFHLDVDSLAELLLLRAVPAPHTLVANVEKVLPGHVVTIDRTGARLDETYWDLSGQHRTLDLSPEEATEELHRLLQLSVAENMIADVPVGAYLSGGVDSSLIVALASRATGAARLKTFTAGFAGGEDERVFAQRVSDSIGTDHHTVMVQPGDFLSEVTRLTHFRDAPVSETSDVAVAALARLAAEHVTVVLSGEGSDELFAGYPKYRVIRPAAWLGSLPAGIRSPLINAGRRFAGSRNARVDVALRAMSGRNEWERLAGWFSSFTAAEAEHLVGRPLRAPQGAARTLSGDVVKRMGVVDCAAWLPDNLLERGDRMTMAASIELRPPFLDPRVVDFALALPSSIKLHGRVNKWPVKQVAAKYIDADLVTRPKNGFRVPLGSWLRTDLAEQARELLTGQHSQIADLVDRRTVTSLLEQHISGTRDNTKQIWPLMTLEIFMRTVINSASPVPV